MTTVKIEGLRELERALAELPTATGKGVLRRVGMAALKPVEAAAQAKAPRLEGDLSVSIVTAPKLTRRQARAARKAGKSSIEVYTGTKDAAAIPQEFGTVRHGAQPFLRPAWDANKAGVLDHVATQMGNEIEKAAARRAKKLGR